MSCKETLSKKIGYLIFYVIGFLFVFFCKTGENLAEWGNILWTTRYTLTTIVGSLVLGCLIGRVFASLFYGLAEGKWSGIRAKWHLRDGGAVQQTIADRMEGLRPVQIFFISLALILLSWLPVYLAYYPGICAYDSTIQTGQAVDNFYIDHHPIIHTMLIKGFMNLGKNVLGDTNTGIAVYTACQMLLLASAMSYGILLLHRYKVKVRWQVLTLVGCMIYPFNWYMSVSMTKDTVFTAFFLLQLLALISVLLDNEQTWKFGIKEVLLFIGTVGMILFRNNGRYAMLVLLVFLVLMVWRGKTARRLWGRLLVCCGIAFLVGNIGLSALFSVTKAEQGDRREMLSMPIQQLARCMIYHGGVGVLPEDDNTMEDVDKALINDFILYEGYKTYNPSLADPVKGCTNTYVVRYRAKDFLTTYFRLLKAYPGDFINAALAVNAGFLYPDDISHAYVNANKGVSNMGYVQTHWEEETLNPRGLYIDSKWEWLHEKLENWADENAYLKLPVLKYLFVPGMFLWFYLLLFGYLLITRRFRMCLPLSLVAGYYLTMFLGPTVQLRYLYPVMLTLPFLILLGTIWLKQSDGKVKK